MTRKQEEVPQQVLEAIETFPQCFENLRERLIDVHGWVEGKHLPPVPQDFPALVCYALIYLHSSSGVRLPSPGKGTMFTHQLAYKRLFFRQAVHVARHVDPETPDAIKDLIDRTMEGLQMPTRYEYAAAGTEVVLSTVQGAGPVFMRLKCVVEAAADLLLEIPDKNSSPEDRRQWDMLARCFATVLGSHTYSQCHGSRIKRILSIYLSVAANLDMVDLGVLCCSSGHATLLEDIPGAVRDLEIDLGLRAAVKPSGSYADWKANRREARRRKRERAS